GDILSGGDGGDARKASLAEPAGIAFDRSGNTYVTERTLSRIRRIDRTGVISTIAGTGLSEFSGDNGPAVRAALNGPTALEVDAAGNIYVADAGNNRIRRIDTRGVITTIAGGGTTLGDGGPAIRANLKLKEGPTSGGGLAFDAAGNLYIADTF